MNTVSRSGWGGLKVHFPGLPPFTLLSRFHIPGWEGLVFDLCLVSEEDLVFSLRLTEFCHLVLSLQLSFNWNDPILQMDEKTKAQKRAFCPMLLSQLVMEFILEHRSPDSPAMWKGIQRPASSTVNSSLLEAIKNQGSPPRTATVKIPSACMKCPLKISLMLWFYNIMLDLPDFKKPIIMTTPPDKV